MNVRPLRRRRRGNALALTLVAVLALGAAVGAAASDTLRTTAEGRAERYELQLEQSLRGAAEGLRADLAQGRSPAAEREIGGALVRVTPLDAVGEFRLLAMVRGGAERLQRTVTVRIARSDPGAPRIVGWDERVTVTR